VRLDYNKLGATTNDIYIDSNANVRLTSGRQRYMDLLASLNMPPGADDGEYTTLAGGPFAAWRYRKDKTRVLTTQFNIPHDWEPGTPIIFRARFLSNVNEVVALNSLWLIEYTLAQVGGIPNLAAGWVSEQLVQPMANTAYMIVSGAWSAYIPPAQASGFIRLSRLPTNPLDGHIGDVSLAAFGFSYTATYICGDHLAY
jgi:hypothetical protein